MVQLAEETREVDLLGMGVCVRVPWARGIARVRDGQAADFARTRESDYLIDANNPTGYAQVIEAWNPGPTLIRCHTIGLDLVTQWTTNCGLVYLLTDGHGSTRLVTDPDGDVTHEPYNQQDQWFTYDAYGNLLETPAYRVTMFLYAGEQYSAATDLYYLRARYYDPSTGRFTALDPAAGSPQDPISLHKYLYAAANPVMNTDPTGMWTYIDVGFAVSILSLLAGITVPTIIKVHDVSIVNTAINNARVLVRDVIIKLSRWALADQNQYRTWFGLPNTANPTHVNNGYVAIQKALTERITWYKTNNPYFASVIPGGPVNIELARKFWSAPTTGVDCQAGVLVHEISHEVWGTRDWVYGTIGCKSLALVNPTRAINNADSYEYFAEGAR